MKCTSLNKVVAGVIMIFSKESMQALYFLGNLHVRFFWAAQMMLRHLVQVAQFS